MHTSRSARIRAHRRTAIRTTKPETTQPETTRPDIRACDVAGIRNVGYQPSIARGRVRYSGSGDAGYTSDWSRPANLPYSISSVTSDRRWSK